MLYLLNQSNGALVGMPGLWPSAEQSARAGRNAPLSTERYDRMLVLSAILVALLHLWLALRWWHAETMHIEPAKPLTMEISMINLAAPSASQTPPLPSPPPPKVEPQVKPATKALRKPLPIKTQTPATPTAQAEPAQPASSAAPIGNPAPAVETKTQAPAEQPFTEANFKANYASNPKPEYPSLARSREWQGKVLIRVNVSADGLSEGVSLEKSSGHDVLDEAAMEAVKKWRFIPARRGDTAVASSVIVPIIFSLTE